MLLKIGQRPDHGFDEPLGLLSDCHRRIEHFLAVLLTIADQANGQELSADQRRQLEGALTYFSTAAPRHTADEEDSLFPRLEASTPRGEASSFHRRAGTRPRELRDRSAGPEALGAGPDPGAPRVVPEGAARMQAGGGEARHGLDD